MDAELDSAANSTDVMQQISTAMSSITSALSATSFSDMISKMAGPAVRSANVEETAGGTVASNASDGAPMQRLLLNLKRFGRGDQGMLLNGTTAMGVAVLPAPPGGSYRDSNYDRLLNDLVQESSQKWALNKFRSGSVGGATIDQWDSGGRPARVSAGYIFDGLQGHSSSRVTLTFVEGVPKCLYFADAPDS